MKLQAKVTSIHSGSIYTDGQQRVTITFERDEDNKFNQASIVFPDPEGKYSLKQ